VVLTRVIIDPVTVKAKLALLLLRVFTIKSGLEAATAIGITF
jgi:hypothetical protein